LEGQPFLPKSYQTTRLDSWTSVGDSTNQYFTGTAKYSVDFDWKSVKESVIYLNLGNVRESAKVTLNGQSLGTLWCLPFQVAIPTKLLKEKNHLEIEVKTFQPTECDISTNNLIIGRNSRISTSSIFNIKP
jgi:hypothetical protein